jgi:GGDEF domain-containing protein
MISLKQSLSELDRLDSMQRTAMECYHSAIEAASRNAVETEESWIRSLRDGLEELARRVARASSAEELRETRVALQGELQEYSAKGSRYVRALRDKLSETSRSLSEVAQALARGVGGDGPKLEEQLGRAAALARLPEVTRVCPELELAVAGLEDGVARLRRETRLALAQLHEEIQVLRSALDSARQAAVRDPISGLLNRAEALATIRDRLGRGVTFSLLFLWLANLEYVRRRYGSCPSDEVVAQFSKRLLDCLPQGTQAGRWQDDRFVVIVERPKPEAIWLFDGLAKPLGEPFVVKDGSLKREVTLQLRCGVTEASPPATEAGLLRSVDKLLLALETAPEREPPRTGVRPCGAPPGRDATGRASR